MTVIWRKYFRVSFEIHLHTFFSFFRYISDVQTEWLYVYSLFHMNIGSLARMHWKTRKSGRRKSKLRLLLQPEVHDQRQLYRMLSWHTQRPKARRGFMHHHTSQRHNWFGLILSKICLVHYIKQIFDSYIFFLKYSFQPLC